MLISFFGADIIGSRPDFSVADFTPQADRIERRGVGGKSGRLYEKLT
jgi:hypothetical protein